MPPNQIRLTLDRTWAWLDAQTLRVLTAVEAVALLRDPALVAGVATIDRLARTGAVEATQDACQAWQRAVRAAVAAQYPARCRAEGTTAPYAHAWVTDGTGTFCLRCAVRQADLPLAPSTPMPRRTRPGKDRHAE